MSKKLLVIEREAVATNVRLLKEEVKVPIIGVLKGNGYGLGLTLMAQILKEEGITFFAVSEVSEALALRANGFHQEEILLMTPSFQEEEIQKLIEAGVTLTAASFEGAKRYDLYAKKIGQAAKAHIKVDTGFGRFGFLPRHKEEIIKAIRLENLKIEGIYSHFSCAFEKKYQITKKQMDEFSGVIDYLESFSIDLPLKHIANSSAALQFPQTRLSAVRLGSALLGRLPIPTLLGLQKVGYLESQVLSLGTLPADHNVGYANTYLTGQTTDIAVIPVGYQDGYMVEKSKDTFRFMDVLRYLYQDLRSFHKKTMVSINGTKYRVIGRVGLYNIIADVTHSTVSPGDEVRLEINPLFVDSGVERVVR